MSGLSSRQQAYQKLVQTLPVFAPGEPSAVLQDLMGFARQSALGETHTDAEVMEFLSVANRQTDWVPVEILAQQWIPYAFDARTAEIRWCLPQGRAVQPFYDEYITHCRQHLVNALLVPRSSIKDFLRYAGQLPQLPDPSGFIFHVSRCGSTLVSGCLAQLESCAVLSESPLLTEILLAKDMDSNQKKSLLRTCTHLQGRPSSKQPHVMVKWNAWDIFYWQLIRELWPQVPVLLLVRDPVEVLASHARSPGRHMSGDPSLAQVQDSLGSSGECTSLLEFRVRVLQALMTKMLQVRGQSGVSLWDYSGLGEPAVLEICAHFGVAVTPDQRTQVRQKLTRNAKFPGAEFQSDAEEKHRRLPQCQREDISCQLNPFYQRLIQNSNK